MKPSALQIALALTLGVCAVGAQAAVVGTGDRLTINTGIATYDQNGYLTNVTSGSWYGCDCNANGIISGTEKTPMSQGTEGIIIGVTQAEGSPTHIGAPYPTDWNRIDAPYSFFGNTGEHFTVSAITGSTTSGLNFSGWRWDWYDGAYPINMGDGAWGAGFTNGIGNFVWDGVYGHSYTLDYHATIPAGDPSGIGGVSFAYHFEGTVQAVPIPSAAWLFGSGLLGLLGMRRRRKTA